MFTSLAPQRSPPSPRRGAARRDARGSLAGRRHRRRRRQRVAYCVSAPMKGSPANTRSIQEAVNAAKEGDWILIGPGDYKQASAADDRRRRGRRPGRAPTSSITTPDLHIRGMNRNTVMIDGTKPGSPECSSAEADQIFGPAGRRRLLGQQRRGRLQGEAASTCRTSRPATSSAPTTAATRSGSTAAAPRANRKSRSWWGEYLSSTSTYWGGPKSPPTSTGCTRRTPTARARSVHTYANNMSDSGYYFGACPDCRATINHGQRRGQRPRLLGLELGRSPEDRELRIQQQRGGRRDAEPEQRRRALAAGRHLPRRQGPTRTPPHGAQRTNICWVMIHNKVIDNNNGATPTSRWRAGAASARA